MYKVTHINDLLRDKNGKLYRVLGILYPIRRGNTLIGKGFQERNIWRRPQQILNDTMMSRRFIVGKRHNSKFKKSR